MTFDLTILKYPNGSIKTGKYKHYKGGVYEVVGIAKHTETGEDYVIYYDVVRPEKVWIRPLKMFMECVTFDNIQKQRFELIE